MPKMKSNSGALKRFKIKKSGAIKRGSAFRSHILTKMSQKRKRKHSTPKKNKKRKKPGWISLEETMKTNMKLMMKVSLIDPPTNC